MSLSAELVRRLPKVELHCHLDGSLRPESMIDIAQKDQVELPASTPEKLRKLLAIGKNRGSLEEYIQRFEVTLSVLQTPEALERVAYELIEDVARENVRYIEIRYSPILHTRRGMTPDESIDAVKRGLRRGKKDFGVYSGIIVCGIRNISPEVSLKLADLTLRYKNNGVVGFDLAGAEENFPAKHHREAFYLILNNNINATIHAGEAFGPASIHQALHYCGAHRIGHGTRLREDPDLMNYVNDHRIPLEICLTSNWHTRSVRSLRYHPMKYYYEQGIRVTLNTDNRLISDTTMTKEFLLAHELYGFGLKDFRTVTINAAKSAFQPHQIRKVMTRKIADELEAEFGLLPEYIEQDQESN
ncbi:MAG: adenosine deaminase [Candidatus Neomarinimicrobiota bacterium]|nr:MAG: adenosine deaminase [Candidatus Neomarinimicrobiota bacterium]